MVDSGISVQKWFSKDPLNVVPHNYTAISNLDEYSTAINGFLRRLTGRSLASGRLSKGLHETLKTLVGTEALAQGAGGQYRPALGTVILLLAAAEREMRCQPKTTDWFQTVEFLEVGLQPIVPATFDKSATRHAIRMIYEFFKVIVCPKSSEVGDPQSNLLTVTYKTDESKVHRVEMDFRINCLKPDSDRRAGLLEKVQNIPWIEGFKSGDFAPAYWNLREALKDSNGSAKLAVTIFPVTADELGDARAAEDPKFTRVMFNVYE